MFVNWNFQIISKYITKDENFDGFFNVENQFFSDVFILTDSKSQNAYSGINEIIFTNDMNDTNDDFVDIHVYLPEFKCYFTLILKMKILIDFWM